MTKLDHEQLLEYLKYLKVELQSKGFTDFFISSIAENVINGSITSEYELNEIIKKERIANGVTYSFKSNQPKDLSMKNSSIKNVNLNAAQMEHSLVAEANRNLAAWLDKGLIDSPNKVFLTGGELLTVFTSTGECKKEAHVGGEEFVLRDLHIRKGTIYGSFIPLHVARYSYIEMKIDDAAEKMSGFIAILEKLVEGGWEKRMREIIRLEASENEEKKTADKYNTYDNFGTF